MKNVRGTLSIVAITALAYAALAAQGVPAPAAPAATIPLSPAAGGPLPDYQGAAAEQFLLKAKITKVADIPIGVASPRKVTLELNGTTHQAAFKSIDVEQSGYTELTGDLAGEVDFQDSWRTEIAAYQVDLVIGLGRVPATVQRDVKGEQGSLQWWVDSIMMEGDRQKRGVESPNQPLWARETLNQRLFDNLIYNTDRNVGNILIASDWTMRLIDHSRSFRPFDKLRTPKDLTQFSRPLLEGLKKLELKDLQKRVGKYLDAKQIKALLVRRDTILKLAADAVAARGAAAVLY